MRTLALRGITLFVALAPWLFSACDRDDQQIKVYRVSKAPLESTPPPVDATMPTNASSPAADAMAPPSTSEKPDIKWDVPAEWTSTPASAMRYASFAAEKNGEKVDISVVTFPGEGGSDADNVNRWRQQIGLAPLASVDSIIVPIHAGDLHLATVDMAGTSARVLAAWARHDGRSWFFKMTGPAALVEEQKPKFTAFLQSIRF